MADWQSLLEKEKFYEERKENIITNITVDSDQCEF